MPKPWWVHSLRLTFLLIPLIVLSACSRTFQGDEFSFSAPSGFKTKQFEEAEANPNNESELLIFSQKGRLYFQVFRQKIPPDGDLKLVFMEHKEQTSEKTTKYQFISQDVIEMNDQSAIEYVYREFHGEPYVQRREIWLEKSGWAYSLVCTNPADSTPGIEIPIPDLCFRFVEGFRFK